MFTRIVAWIFVIVGFAALLFDVAVSVTLDQRTPVALRRLWPSFNPWSFELAYFLRDTVFSFWFAVAVFGVGLLLLLMFSRAVDRA